MKYIVTQLKINNSTTGNPRRIFIVNNLKGGLEAVHQEGYCDMPEACKGAGYYDHGSLEVTMGQYRSLIKQAKHEGIYHP